MESEGAAGANLNLAPSPRWRYLTLPHRLLSLCLYCLDDFSEIPTASAPSLSPPIYPSTRRGPPSIPLPPPYASPSRRPTRSCNPRPRSPRTPVVRTGPRSPLSACGLRLTGPPRGCPPIDGICSPPLPFSSRRICAVASPKIIVSRGRITSFRGSSVAAGSRPAGTTGPSCATQPSRDHFDTWCTRRPIPPPALATTRCIRRTPPGGRPIPFVFLRGSSFILRCAVVARIRAYYD
mmetsp:Transcript_65/g.153  ORF Transcript_65/g.153 Transcript_65/m.153 type:complete len:236 (+) Transcript_65:604-1311(+)